MSTITPTPGFGESQQPFTVPGAEHAGRDVSLVHRAATIVGNLAGSALRFALEKREGGVIFLAAGGLALNPLNPFAAPAEAGDLNPGAFVEGGIGCDQKSGEQFIRVTFGDVGELPNGTRMLASVGGRQVLQEALPTPHNTIAAVSKFVLLPGDIHTLVDPGTATVSVTVGLDGIPSSETNIASPGCPINPNAVPVSRDTMVQVVNPDGTVTDWIPEGSSGSGGGGSDGSTGTPNTPPTTGTTQLRATSVKVKPVSHRGKLSIDVNPNSKKTNYVVGIYKLNPATGQFEVVRTTKTKGNKDTKKINLPKGTYRVEVPQQGNYASSTSGTAILNK